MPEPIYLGFDFGTESARAILFDGAGKSLASAVAPYASGQIIPGSDAAQQRFDAPLPANFALQDPADWLDAMAAATRQAVSAAGPGARDRIAGLGVAFTSCTMLPCRADGCPLPYDDLPARAPSPLAAHPHAWPKLWKHHGAVEQTARLNQLARARNEPWLRRYGGVIGLEWLAPKIFEVVERDAEAAAAAEVWLEGGDWLVWQLCGSPQFDGHVAAAALARSTCQAGYKGLWSPETGFPSQDYFRAAHPGLAEAFARKVPGRMLAPGARAGTLCQPIATLLDLPAGLPISAAIIDAHAGVPGVGVGECGTLVLVLGTSGCHMMMVEHDHDIPGVAGIVRDGILPGHYGIETGQAAVGDAFDLARRLTGRPFSELEPAAEDAGPGADGLLCVDWFNGCRTPLMDGALTGGYVGMRLEHGPGHLYRATLEGVAFGLRRIVETLEAHGAAVERIVATGGIAHKSDLFLRIVASSLGRPVFVPDVEHAVAAGAAVLGAVAAGADRGFASAAEAVEALIGSPWKRQTTRRIDPDSDWQASYHDLYALYRRTTEQWSAPDAATRALSHPH
ncbi:MAG: ribulokinase [Phycisphaerales bacterium JB039]